MANDGGDYRDELAAAHARIAELEDQLAEKEREGSLLHAVERDRRDQMEKLDDERKRRWARVNRARSLKTAVGAACVLGMLGSVSGLLVLFDSVAPAALSMLGFFSIGLALHVRLQRRQDEAEERAQELAARFP